MLEPSATVTALGAAGTFLVACLAFPASLTLYDRFGPGKSPGYCLTDGLYEDEDGQASEESQKNFKTLAPRIVALVAVILGFLISLTCGVLVTAGVSAGALAENWLRAIAWGILTVQALNTMIDPAPVRRWAQGIYAALSCTVIAVELFVANTSLKDYNYADEILVALMAGQVGLLIVAFGSLISIQRRPSVYDDGRLVDQERTSSFIGMLTFDWASPVIALSEKNRGLEYEDLPQLANSRRTQTLSKRYGAAKMYGKLWKTVVVNFKGAFFLQWTLVTLSSLVEFLPQVAMLNLLRILETKDQELPAVAWLWVALLGVAMLVLTHIDSWLFFIIWSELGIPLRNMLSALIFQKAMKRKDVKGAARKKDATTSQETGEGTIILNQESGPIGEHTAVDTAGKQKRIEDADDELEQKSRQGTINLIGVDTQRVSMFAVYAYFYPGVVVKFAVSIVFLALIIGWQSLIVGFIAFSLTIPLNIWASKNYTHSETKLMELRDRKLAVVTEALQGIRQIKFSALEKQWQAKLSERREKELETQWSAFKYDSIIIFCYIISPVLLSAACLSTYSIIYGELSPSVAFTTIAILSSMEASLSVLPELTTNGIDAWVSIKRIDEYLNAPEKVNCCQPGDQIVFDKADIAWPADDQAHDPDRFILRDINIAIPPKELTVISGKTGSGKSLLLASILGEVDKLAGSIYAPAVPALETRFDTKATKGTWILDSAVAFVAQIPWIENATIRDNILFGLPYDSGRYQATIDSCALTKDLEMLTDGDATEIGHNGVNLSGGQRWRVSFARALYSRAGVLVLDDIFSAVDAHVGRQLFEQALTGELSVGRTRILVTHHVSLVLPKTTYAVHLGDGTVKHAGYVEDLKKTGGLDAVLKDVPAEEPSSGEEEESPDANGHDLTKVVSKRSQRSAMIDDGGLDSKGKDKPKKFIKDEKRETGAIKAAVYKNYINSSGGIWLWIPILLLYFCASGAEVARNWWVAEWTRSYETKSEAKNMILRQTPTMIFQTAFQSTNQSSMYENEYPIDKTVFYLSIYLALSIGMSIVGTLKYLATSMASIRASRVLFDQLAFTVLRAPLRWLDTVPVGRILNRFTADFNVIDSYIAPHTSFFAYKVFEALSITGVSFVVSPTMIPLAILLLAAAAYIARRFIGTARSVKRLENNGKSPIFELFGSVLLGIGTVRGYAKADEYIERMWKRIDQHGRAFWHLWLLNRWMGYRLSMIGSIFAILVAIIIVASSVDASLAGFALSFALQYSEAIIWVLRCYANVELDMTACERVQEFSTLEIETQSGIAAPAAWPTEGKLEVNDLVCGYAPDLPPVLKGLNFTVEKGQRVGVVGRTGAGKSSLTLALFRFLEAREGSVHIDGIDVASITLHDLRSRLAIIPQDPVLFSGTVRSNLDAFNEHTNSELCDALERVHLVSGTTGLVSRGSTTATTAGSGNATPVTESNTNTNIFKSLSSKISEGGLNLSQGQRQLLCLARAIVSRPKIMILDEATSAVDKETDELIQRSIREEFEGSTLLVIAHRLSTIADFDKILVMGEGRVLEYDAPGELMRKEGGAFRDMVVQSGEREVLEGIILGRDGK